MTISYSEISTYLDCQVRWYMNYVLGYRDENEHLEFGTMAHKVLETRVIPDESLYQNLKEFFGITSWERYFTNIFEELDDRMSDYEILHREYRFDTSSLKGVIDSVWKHKTTGKILLSDYKFVTRSKNYDDITSDQQLYIYVLAWLELNPEYSLEDMSIGYISLPKKDLDNPRVLKNGQLSKDKNQFVSYKSYHDKIVELGLDIEEYSEFLESIRDKNILDILIVEEINFDILKRIASNIDNVMKDMKKGYLLEKYPCRSYNCKCNDFLLNHYDKIDLDKLPRD